MGYAKMRQLKIPKIIEPYLHITTNNILYNNVLLNHTCIWFRGRYETYSIITWYNFYY